MNNIQCMAEIASQLRERQVRVFVLPEYSLANFVVLRPNEVKPTRFEPPLTNIQTHELDKASALAALILDRVQVMLDSMKGFLDVHEYAAFVTLNELDMFGSEEIARLAYQVAVIQKKSVVDVVTDAGYGSLQGLHDSILDKRF